MEKNNNTLAHKKSAISNRKQQGNKIRSRRHTLFKKLNEFHELSKAKISTIIYLPNGQIYTYQTDPSWRFNEDVVSIKNCNKVIYILKY